jgi:hypothetical protein
MNTRHSARWFWAALAAVFLSVIFVANDASTQTQNPNANAKVTTSGGLTVVTFNVSPGTIRANLPDDLRAGDTISGTVICEPKGNTEEERKKNQSELKKMGIKLFPRGEDKSEEVNCGDVSMPFKVLLYNNRESHVASSLVVAVPGTGISQVSIPVLLLPFVPLTQPTHPSGAIITPDPKITQPTHPSGAIITPDPKITPPKPPSGEIITIPASTFGSQPVDRDIVPGFDIPPLGQTGKPIVITGPFDGNSSNTTAGVGTSGGLQILAESPRKAVFENPSKEVGPTQITVKEGTTQTTGNFRNVGVNLTAPKTSLLKGESTELHVEVQGLEGIKEPVPLHLTKGGVVTMQGGDSQTMSIQPSQVQSNGTFTTTRKITGVETGGWSATATVVVYDICIQDDTDPSRVLLFMTTTSDFKFCPGTGSGANAAAPISLGTSDFTGGISVQAGDGLDVVTRNGAITVGDFSYAGSHTQFQVDSFSHSGNATVRMTNPDQTFTITDRDTRNNTCTCK